MSYPRRRKPLLLAVTIIFGMASWLAAAVIGDGPVITQHLDEHKIERGEVPLQQVIDAGAFLFSAKFNTFDGQGRPGTTGGGAARVSGSAPRFIRTSAPESNSCAGCHNDPNPGGAGDIVANVFVLAQTLDPVNPSVDAQFSDERNTLGMNGSGLIEMLAREMTDELQAVRAGAVADAKASGGLVTRPLVTKGVSFGSISAAPSGTLDTTKVVGVDADLEARRAGLHGPQTSQPLRQPDHALLQ